MLFMLGTRSKLTPAGFISCWTPQAESHDGGSNLNRDSANRGSAVSRKSSRRRSSLLDGGFLLDLARNAAFSVSRVLASGLWRSSRPKRSSRSSRQKSRRSWLYVVYKEEQERNSNVRAMNADLEEGSKPEDLNVVSLLASLLTTRYSLPTTSLRTTNYELRTTHNSPLTTHYSLLTT